MLPSTSVACRRISSAKACSAIIQEKDVLAVVILRHRPIHFVLWEVEHFRHCVANVAPLVGYLATASCPFTGATFYVQGGAVKVVEGWSFGGGVEQDGRWRVEDLAEALAPLSGRA